MKIKLQYFLLAFAAITSLASGADRLTIYNKTPYDLYVSLYYLGMKLHDEPQPNAILASSIIPIKAQASTTINNLVRKVKRDRYLVFVTDSALLAQELSKEQLEKLKAKDVGDMRGDVFVIGYIDNELNGYSPNEWKVSLQAHKKYCSKCKKRKSL